ncbi:MULTISPECIES: hypothetical protein [Gordonia]|uniref:Uncharacterized protein n=1 Tax=Gordonia amicalis TaxID=89053 RepID=A0AAE4R9H9_9ACTN|nr:MULTISPECIES: hypothetical protein [Gordonia]ATD72665.1 hypothetical protein CNO18_22785 [Gordonia sp. 1D]KAF0971382.1 hypothetical protein BPODLACK_00568 [Gordonia sp. YY1]MCR8898263.1 hypothetical protein [Gordonia sp. GONU]MCZ0915274.1 hypothetical protein [Gordonia amicalis]MCZ4578354.1 hypothetical protein [Gordonia amicalis]
MSKVIDTNVPLVVKFPDDRPIALVEACEEILEEIIENGLPVVTDELGEIIEEYFHQLSRGGQPTLGDAFAKYVYDNRHSWDEAVRPDIEPDTTTPNSYAVLGGDDAEIDPSDRKLVAAAKVAGVPVLQATDTKWLNWGEVLSRHGVRVEYVHEPSIRAAYRAKFGCDAP